MLSRRRTDMEFFVCLYSEREALGCTEDIANTHTLLQMLCYYTNIYLKIHDTKVYIETDMFRREKLCSRKYFYMW